MEYSVFIRQDNIFVYCMHEYEQGQILLIVVLVMVTALTVGLSVAARSVTNTRTSEAAANSEKAFSAAEAGIEQSLALVTPAVVNGTFTNNSSYSTTVVTVAGQAFALNNGSPVLQDSPMDLWLSKYPGYTNQWSGNFTIYWGQSANACSQAALEVLVLSGTTATPQLTRYAFDPCAARQATNHFTLVTTSSYPSIPGGPYTFSSTTINVIGGFFARITPLYAPASIGVTGCTTANTNCSSLPSQGSVIQSTGTSADTQREVVTYRYYPSLPTELLQYNFFAP